jgi:chromosome partitioning protein
MQTILVANPKGGSGKTTLATNVAGWLAGKRQRVLLSDLDPQRSSAEWLEQRPRGFPPIGAGSSELAAAAEPVADWRVIDSPAGLHGEALRALVEAADALLVPVSASAFDIAATRRFLAAVTDVVGARPFPLATGLVAMRVDLRTKSAAELDAFLHEAGDPLTHLRETQVYVHCARDGASIFDLPRSRAEQDWEQWRPLTRWIARQAPTRSDDGA